jgi:pimeloyl-ACP methyl ester carboxylesterase
LPVVVISFFQVSMNEPALSLPPLAVQTRGTGPALLLFHGGMGSWNHWARNLDALARVYTVHALDLPGYGRSPSVSKSGPKEQYIEAVVASIQPLVGAQPFRLAGFSFGGVVAAMTAARLGAQVLKLSLLGVGGFGNVQQVATRSIPDESAGVAAYRDTLRYNLGVLMLADPANVTEESIDFYAENYRATRFDGRPFSLSTNVVTALAQIRCPLQFIFGAQDSLADADLERRREIVRSQRPDAEFIVLPGAGHWVQYEAAEQVNALLFEFFA